MEPSSAADFTPGLNSVGGSFQAGPKKSSRKAKHGTFPRAARVTDEFCPVSHTSTGPEFHNQHGSFVWQHGSVSKKGYTSGFISQTPRLGTSFRYTGPGPGTASVAESGSAFMWYDTSVKPHLRVQVRIRLQAGATSCTAHQTRVSFQRYCDPL